MPECVSPLAGDLRFFSFISFFVKNDKHPFDYPAACRVAKHNGGADPPAQGRG
jgi:hypothetical protein